MWDNREGKRNPKAPDFKCKDRECGGVIWPSRSSTATGSGATGKAAAPSSPEPVERVERTSARGASVGGASSAGAGNARVSPEGMPLCPICGGSMWDDRLTKRNPRAPDFKCRNRPRERGGPGCEGVIWPPRDGAPSPYPPPVPRRQSPAPPRQESPPAFDGPPPEEAPRWDEEDLPF
jgi:hypothetical protein